MLGLLTGVVIAILKDVLLMEYRKWRDRVEKVKQIREELRASAISLCNTWHTFKGVKSPYLDLRKEILEAAKEVLEYLNYYDTYGGKRKISENIKEALHRITDLASRNHGLESHEWSIKYSKDMDRACVELLKAVRSA